jgi:glutamate formiminotransferase / 5-formyltetrahydrofolate cyclo-ligase
VTLLLEAVVNVSEGQRLDLLAELTVAAGPLLLDVHRDAHHNRSVFTLAGAQDPLAEAVRSLAAATVARLDLGSHVGVHPRICVLDVVPWVALSGWPLEAGPIEASTGARDAFARWAGDVLQLPCFVYGTQRSLPEVRRDAWHRLAPTTGPASPHPTAGAAAVGARGVLVAYNLWLGAPDADLDLARRLAAELRGPSVRALGLQVGDAVQVSCNLIDPVAVGPAAVFDAVATRSDVARAELVGLVPARVLAATPEHRWPELDLDRSRTIEARLERAGLDGGRM